MEAYADPLQYFKPDPPNTTKPEEVLEKLKSNDSSTKVSSLFYAWNDLYRYRRLDMKQYGFIDPTYYVASNVFQS